MYMYIMEEMKHYILALYIHVHVYTLNYYDIHTYIHIIYYIYVADLVGKMVTLYPVMTPLAGSGSLHETLTLVEVSAIAVTPPGAEGAGRRRRIT